MESNGPLPIYGVETTCTFPGTNQIKTYVWQHVQALTINISLAHCENCYNMAIR